MDYIDYEDAIKFIVKKYNYKQINKYAIKFYQNLDRYNSEVLYNAYFEQEFHGIIVTDDRTNSWPKLRVGWSKDYLLPYYFMDRSVIENHYELPIIYELLNRGCELVHISQRVGTENKPSFLPFREPYTDRVRKTTEPWLKLKETWDALLLDKTMSMVGRFKSMIDKLYEVESVFPEIDILILDAFPSFEARNVWIYCLWYVYGILRHGRTMIVAADHENRTIANVGKNGVKNKRPFRFSGADNAFKIEEMNKMASVTVWGMFIREEAMDRVRKNNPSITIVPFCLPYDVSTGYMFPKSNPEQEIVYIGNDLERRKMIVKYLCKLENFNPYIYGGLKKFPDGGYEPKFKERHKNINWMGVLPFKQVYNTYNNSYACLGISRSYNYYIGHNVTRTIEVPMSGSIMLMPREYYDAKSCTVFSECIVKDSEDLDGCLQDLIDAKYETRCRINSKQRLASMDFTSISYGLDNIFNCYKSFTNAKKGVPISYASI